jgi:hypothetical protein
MLSMLEGNVLNGPIGKEMVDALDESQQCVNDCKRMKLVKIPSEN